MTDMAQADRTLYRTHTPPKWSAADDRSINYSPTMRISREHYLELMRLVSEHDTNERRDRYRKMDFPRSDACRDEDQLNKRYRWDMIWVADQGQRRTLFDAMYHAGLNDDHIDTALRRIVPEL